MSSPLPHIDIVTAACQVLKRSDEAKFAPVIRFLLDQEQQERHVKSSKPKVRNVQIRGGGGKVSKIKLGVTDADWKRATE